MRILALLTLLTACGPNGRPDQGAGDVDAPAGTTIDAPTPVCASGFGECVGDVSHVCSNDGLGFVDTLCDPVMGMTCDVDSGRCTGVCAPGNLGSSYIGCEYFPTIIGNTVGNQFTFAIAVSNTGTTNAAITIDGGALGAAVTFTVAPGGARVEPLPWVPELKLCNTPNTDGCYSGGVGTGALAKLGAYHVRSTQPVTVYQFSALDYSVDGFTFSYSNDASLLMPTNAWRSDYLVAAWRPMANYPSELAVTATRNGTQVTIETRANTPAAPGVPQFWQGLPQTVTLDAGDVIELTSTAGDLTGSRVTADGPVQVISGHFCARVPDNVAACDHLEESMFPVDALGTRYLINAPALTTMPNGKIEVIRIVATQPNTTLVYNPPQPNAPMVIANAGDVVELAGNAASFELTASAKVLVAQYMEGQFAGGDYGDPAMALAVPVDQYRKSYVVHAPVNYQQNFIDVTAPTGATVLLDGVPLSFTPIGNTGYGLARAVEITTGPNDDGGHTIESAEKVGVSVYGYGQYTSYWYPGGLDLRNLIF